MEQYLPVIIAAAVVAGVLAVAAVCALIFRQKPAKEAQKELTEQAKEQGTTPESRSEAETPALAGKTADDTPVLAGKTAADAPAALPSVAPPAALPPTADPTENGKKPQ